MWQLSLWTIFLNAMDFMSILYSKDLILLKIFAIAVIKLKYWTLPSFLQSKQPGAGLWPIQNQAVQTVGEGQACAAPLVRVTDVRDAHKALFVQAVDAHTHRLHKGSCMCKCACPLLGQNHSLCVHLSHATMQLVCKTRSVGDCYYKVLIFF